MNASVVHERGAAVRFPVPPLLFAAPLAAALLAGRVLPLPLPGRSASTGAGIALVLGGVVFSLSGAATVLRHRTTVVPHRPVARLVTGGPFRISRNPMYTGHAVSCAGAALWAGSGWPLTSRLCSLPGKDRFTPLSCLVVNGVGTGCPGPRRSGHTTPSPSSPPSPAGTTGAGRRYG